MRYTKDIWKREKMTKKEEQDLMEQIQARLTY